DVTLDPDTAHPRLSLSLDRRSVKLGERRQELPENPKRFDSDYCVLGSQGFSGGPRHYWDVDVAQGLYCAVGVSRESPARKSGAGFSPAEGIWAVQQWGFQNRALTEPPTLLALPRVPRRIRVSLDYEWGEVAFWDAESRDPIFTF
ncbi:Butyrophilin subfamily 2 member A2, partial [Tinamus guttatus]